MAGRSPARFLAPLALVAFAVALAMVLSSSNGDEASLESGSPQPTATATSEGAGEKASKGSKGKSGGSKGETYTVKAGDTPSGIAAEFGLSTQELLELNPSIDPNALTVGEEIRVE